MHSQHNAGEYLERSEDIGALMPKARQLVELSRRVADLLPESLSQSCAVANVRQGKLVLFAENSVVAARLKLLAPTLRNQLLEAGHEATVISVEVQPRASWPRPAAPAPRALSRTAGETLGRLSAALPDSPLKSVLERLAGRAEKP